MKIKFDFSSIIIYNQNKQKKNQTIKKQENITKQNRDRIQGISHQLYPQALSIYQNKIPIASSTNTQSSNQNYLQKFNSMIGSQIFNENFSEDKLIQIAKGGFSQIFKLIVIKKMKSEDESTLQYLCQEANLIKRLYEDNPNLKNVIQIFSQYQHSNSIYIAMEYCPMGSLEKLLTEKQKLSHMEILIFAKQMISVLMYTHKLGLAHSDLKPENVLIRSPNEYVLTDWGSAQQLSHQHSTTLRDNTYFTPGYQAPELQNENLISSNMKFNYFAADVYSLGMMLLRCTGPSFREIRTISSEADQSDHDWKLNKLFKTYLYQSEFQDGIVDKIISGFLNYSKVSRMKLEEALFLINQTYPNIENYLENINNTNNQLYGQNTSQSQLGQMQYIDDNIQLSQLKISTIQNINIGVNSQQHLKKYSIQQDDFTAYQDNSNKSSNSTYIDNISNINSNYYGDSIDSSSNRSNSIANNKISEFQNISDNMNSKLNLSNNLSTNTSGTGSNQSSKKIEKDGSMDRKDSSRQRIREIKRNKSQDKCKVNKNISISFYHEIFKISNDIDNFKAYLNNQVHDGNIQHLCQKVLEFTNVKKLFLSIGGSNDLSDYSINQLQCALENKMTLQELSLDVANSTKVNLSSINCFLKEIYTDKLESISLSLCKININEGDIDEFLANLLNIQSLKRISLSFSQCSSITEDDIDFICESVEDCDNLDKFYLICPKNTIDLGKAASIEKKLTNQISDVKITISC